MAESQGDVYVREIDARLRRIETLYEKTEAEIRDVKSEMMRLDSKFDSIRNMYMWGTMGFWIILSLATAFAVIKRIYQPVTAEDVERVVHETITAKTIEALVAHKLEREKSK